MSDKAPYIVSLILGVLGWLVAHIVDRVTEAPTLEYQAVLQANGTGRRLEVEVVNVTRNQRFDRVMAIISFPDALVHDPQVVTIGPAKAVSAPPRGEGATATFDLGTIMPGATIDFGASRLGSAEPVLRIWSEASTPVRPQQRGFETRFVRHEVLILLGLVFVWIVALAGIWYWQFRAGRRSSTAPASSTFSSGAYTITVHES